VTTSMCAHALCDILINALEILLLTYLLTYLQSARPQHRSPVAWLPSVSV